VAMWGGAAPTIIRAMLLSSTMLASYSEFKLMLHRARPEIFPAEGLSTMFCGTMMASLVANTVVNPFDVIKSRTQMHVGEYTSIADCFRKSIAQDGIMVLWRGFLPAFVKLAPYTVISLITTEKISVMMTGRAAV